jgi:hypothetical protein
MKKILFIFLLTGLLYSCDESYLETLPTTQIASTDVFTTTANGWAAINGIHRKMYSQWMSSQDMGGYGGMMIAMDAMGEDLVFPVNQWYANSVYKWLPHRSTTALWTLYPWNFWYQVINNSNQIIANIDNATGSDSDKKRIKSEALAYRAWGHFYIVQLYGSRYVAGQSNTQLGVPLMKTSTVEPQVRATVEEVYTHINSDLNEAATLLVGAPARSNKSHIDLNVINGIKARVLLTQGKWAEAAAAAATARTGYSLMTNTDYKGGFSKATNPEWMWSSIMIVDQTIYFYSYFAFISYNFNSTAIRTCPKCINSILYNTISATDVRKGIWWPTTTSLTLPTASFSKKAYMNTKFAVSDYTSSVGDLPLMRAGEMYLIEAEALARQGGKDTEAQNALYTLAVHRDPSYVKSTKTGQDLIDEIMLQRRVELWGEGFRFFDLKRLNLPLNRNGANHVTSQASKMDVAAGDKEWQWLIPQDEINANPKMVQNPL